MADVPTDVPTDAPTAACRPDPLASAEPGVDLGVDLNEELIPHPGHTVLVRVCGDSMTGAGIRPGDLLIVDRRVEPRAGRIVVALLAEGFTLKRLASRRQRWWLEAANPAYPPLELEGGGDARLWGVALHVIRSLPGSG
jgi:DNA polymerase V